MAELGPGSLKLMAYYGTIVAGTLAHDTTSQIWARINAAAEAQGFAPPAVSATALNPIRQLASQNAYAAERLNAQPAGASIQSEMIGVDPSFRFAVAENPVTQYNVRFEHNVVENGVASTIWRTDQFTGALPPTIDQLRERLDADAQLLADEYNQAHVGIGAISIALG